MDTSLIVDSTDTLIDTLVLYIITTGAFDISYSINYMFNPEPSITGLLTRYDGIGSRGMRCLHIFLTA